MRPRLLAALVVALVVSSWIAYTVAVFRDLSSTSNGTPSPFGASLEAPGRGLPGAAGSTLSLRGSLPAAATRSRALPPSLPLEKAALGRRGQRAPDWHALAMCESTDDPRAVSPSGRYRGLYQFDLHTWRSVGGTGDPARATRSEQTRRAQQLYAERGRQPWPYCGRFL